MPVSIAEEHPLTPDLGLLFDRHTADMHADTPPESIHMMPREALIRTGALRDIDAAFISKSGERIPILFSRTAVLDAEGKIENIICIAKNMRGYRKIDEPAGVSTVAG